MKAKWLLGVSMVVAAVGGLAGRAADMGTAITYQGDLAKLGVPVTDTCDFRFGLWDAAGTGDPPIGGALVPVTPPGVNPVIHSGVSVTNGLFIVNDLDFGGGAFDGTARWLAIEVYCPGDGGFAMLSPRVELTPAPYALALPGLYTQQNATSPNLIGGYSGNVVSPSVWGATIGGGGHQFGPNQVTGDTGTVGGGELNTAGAEATVGGGYNNTASGGNSTIGGGITNEASGEASTVGGGDFNTAGAQWSTVAGGASNTAIGSYSTVGGGYSADASGNNSTVGGGYDNTASRVNSTVGGGGGNSAKGFAGTVPGGQENQAGGDYSFAAGRRAKVRTVAEVGSGTVGDQGTFVWADAAGPDFQSTGQNQFLIRAAGGVGIGTNAPAAQLEVKRDSGPGTPQLLLREQGSDYGRLTFQNDVNTNAWTIAALNTATADNDRLNFYHAPNGDALSLTGSGIIAVDPGAENTGTLVSSSLKFGGVGSGEGIASKRIGGTGLFGLDFYTNWTNRMTVSNGGNVGIRTPAPTEELEIEGDIKLDGTSLGSQPALFWSVNSSRRASAFLDSGGILGHLNFGRYNSAGTFVDNVMSIWLDSGSVCIGGSCSLKGKVEISGGMTEYLSYGYLNVTGATGTAGGFADYSLYASERIAASEFNAHSDARLKNIRRPSNAQQDLKALMGIEVTDYTMIDTVANGDKEYKKVIAQQVEKVYPQAVSVTTDVVPDIYRMADAEQGRVRLDGLDDLEPKLKAGDRVRLLTDKGADIHEVIEADEGGFRVAEPLNGQVFVYGREVDDFHSVDYDALAMLNVSSTQELYRLLLQQQEAIDKAREQTKDMDELRGRIEALESARAGSAGQAALPFVLFGALGLAAMRRRSQNGGGR